MTSPLLLRSQESFCPCCILPPIDLAASPAAIKESAKRVTEVIEWRKELANWGLLGSLGLLFLNPVAGALGFLASWIQGADAEALEKSAAYLSLIADLKELKLQLETTANHLQREIQSLHALDRNLAVRQREYAALNEQHSDLLRRHAETETRIREATRLLNVVTDEIRAAAAVNSGTSETLRESARAIESLVRPSLR